MSPTDLQLAQLACVDIYAPVQGMDILTIDGVTLCVVKVDDYDVIVFRGSRTPMDWYRDVVACYPVNVPGLGHVHSGFYRGLEGVLPVVLPALGKSVIVTGHSLGAGEAPIFTAMLALAGVLPKACVMFAPPRPGLEDFRDMYAMLGVATRGYANDGDPIPHVPEPLLPLFPWASVCRNSELSVMPDMKDPDVLFRCHHGALYYQGIKQLAEA